MSDSKLEGKVDLNLERTQSIADSVAGLDKNFALLQLRFNSHLDEEEHIAKEIKSYNAVLAENTHALKEHMYRTELLEGIATKLDLRLQPLEQAKLREQAIKEWLTGKVVLTIKIAAAGTGITAFIAFAKNMLSRFHF